MSVLDVINIEQIRKLRELGYVVVHSQPTESMRKAAIRDQWPEQYGPADVWHRMIAESIRLQQNEIKDRISWTKKYGI